MQSPENERHPHRQQDHAQWQIALTENLGKAVSTHYIPRQECSMPGNLTAPRAAGQPRLMMHFPRMTQE